MSKANQGKNNPNYGKAKAIGAGKASQKIEVKDILKNKITIYDSICSAAAALKIKQSTISLYFSRKQKSAYKGRFEFYKLN